MPGLRKFTRIPPESTGDRIRVKSHTEIYYDNRSGDINRDLIVTLQTSGLSGRISRVRADTGTTGIISVNFDEASEDADNTTPITGENIQIDGLTVATVAAIPPFDTYANVQSIVSYDNQYYGQKVSEQGEAYIRFGDGPARVDASGKLEVAEPTILAQYSFQYDTSPDEFSNITTGSGSITHSTPANCVLLTATTNASDSVKLRSDLWHHYTPGIPIIYEGTTAHSDAGKLDQVRRWGIFDDNDGLFFELDGTALSFVRRNSTGGSVVETKVAQSAWNRDTFDGTGTRSANPSGIQLDITKINAYWIDYTWHGAGIVRFGVFSDGQRLVAHVESFANQEPLAYMSRGSLPITWEIENTGTTASTTEMRAWSASVYASTTLDIVKEAKTYTHANKGPTTLSGSTETQLVSFRPTVTLNGVENHSVASFVQINAISYDTVTFADGLVKIRGYIGGTFGAAAWAQAAPTSSLEKDTSGTYNNDGFQVSEFYIKGTEYIDLDNILGYWYGSILPDADGTIPIFSFTAQRMAGANDAAIDLQLRWKEVKG